MRRVRFAVLLVLSMTLAGCLGPSTATWGADSGELHVDFSQESTTVKSGLGSESMEISGIEAIGCASDVGELGSNNSGTVSFSGYLAASHFYSSHSPVGGANGLDYGVATSVAIQRMSIQDANNVVEGDGSRIDVKNWDVPLNPETGAGSVDLDEVDRDSDTRWYILGLIPTTENIHNGLTALDEWHQSVTINGYLVQTDSSGNAPGYYNYQTAEDDCSLAIGTQNKENAYVLVTSIQLDGAVISSDGESSDEWVHGDVPLIGRAGYVLFFLAFGIGGAVGAFILSKMFVMQGAKSTMKTLLGKAGMDNIKQVKKDVKSAKASGMTSPAERKAAARKHASDKKPQESNKASSEPELAGFDLDSVLSSGPSMGSTTEFGGKGSSVVETIESQEMEREITEQSSDIGIPIQSSSPPWQSPSKSSVTSSQPPRQQREHFTSSAPTSKKASGPPSRKTVRKRKASTPKQETPVAPEEEPKQTSRETFEEPDEEFSDFSF